MTVIILVVIIYAVTHACRSMLRGVCASPCACVFACMCLVRNKTHVHVSERTGVAVILVGNEVRALVQNAIHDEERLGRTISVEYA